MNWIPHQTPTWLKSMYPQRIWDFKSKSATEKCIYLTFDDGPIPEVTPWVLDTLKKYNAKATFFCIGENVEKHYEIAQQLVHQGHRIGNHTFYHANGWKTSVQEYSKQVFQVEDLFQKLNCSSSLFRPPYGKMTSRQAHFLMQQGYQLIMWDVLSKDYKPIINLESVLKKTIAATSPGSIVVFHDSKKAFANLQFLLPKFLSHFREKGYEFKSM